MKILLVDDDDSIRKSISKFLDRLGYSVKTCENGEAALNLLNNEKFNLVLSDVKMPVMDGFELLKEIKKSDYYKDLLVVLFTGHGDVKGAVDAMREGAYDYLLKPVNIKELTLIIERAAEFLSLKKENIKLTTDFKNQVNIATNEIKSELHDLRKAFAKAIGVSDVGIFSDKMADLYSTVSKLNKNPDIPVLLEGETGTGKEVVARSIHYGNGEKTGPFIDLNCAAISSTLFESELFGYESGAFTGGNPKGQKGKLELAEDGTILLDEISELPTEFQAKFLRVIQEREYYPIGGLKKKTTNARFICTTNRNVQEATAGGDFREDLFYRLSVGHLYVPALKERKVEILPLASMFLKMLTKDKKTTFSSISPEAEKIMKEYSWPGNIRQLKGVIERVSLLFEDSEITPRHLNYLLEKNISVSDTERIFEKEITLENLELPEENFELISWTLNIIEKALNNHNGNKSKTANYLGISRNELYTYLKKIE